MTTPSRLVRVFISSTFRDFIEERDELVKKVFPELRRRCKERFVEVLEVDLRWGITEEQSKCGETLRICLEEIDRCRPSAPVFFVGLLGERYGWIPKRDYFKKDVLEDPNLGWVKEHIEGKSVTELEILHGVLRNEQMRDKSFFYFRNDGYQERHWDAIARHHAGIEPPIESKDFTNEKSPTPEVDDAKQRDLKKRVRDVSFKWEPKDYETPQDMAELILEDLWAAINEVFPAQSVPGETERQRLEHEVFGHCRVAGYVPRLGLFDQLDSVLIEPSPSIRVVGGESGSGKSALLAAWLDYLGEGKPESRFVHFIGGTPESSTARSIVMRLLAEIRAWGAISEPLPEDFHEAVQVLPQWLERVAQKDGGGVLLVLDALNQLEDPCDQRLSWLPRQFPPGVRLVISTLPGPAEDELRARGWMEKMVVVPPLDPSERRAIIERFLKEAGKDPAALPVDKLAMAPQSGNALYLRVVLNELKMRACFGKVDALLDDLLQAKNPSELFVRVLKNLEEFETERPDLVRESLGYLALARRGLTEGELLELLSKDARPSSNPLPRHYWSPLYLALADSLVSRNGELGFFHDYLRQAVNEEYLDEDWEKRRIHNKLGEIALSWCNDCFSPTLRRYGLANGAWHLRNAAQHEKIWNILSDKDFHTAQLEEFKRVHEIINSLKDGIATYVQRKGQLETDDARLAWMIVQCGEVAQNLHGSIRHLLQNCLCATSTTPDRLREVIKELKSLDNSHFLHVCLFLLYNESFHSLSSGKSISVEFLNIMRKELAGRIDGTIEVVPEVLQQEFTQNIPQDFWEYIQSISRCRKNICAFFEVNCQDDLEHFDDACDDNADAEEDAVLADEAIKLAGKKDWSGALQISAQLAIVRNRSDLLHAISRAQSEHGLLKESLNTFVLATTQQSEPCRKDWGSLVELCLAVALKSGRGEALKVSEKITDALARSKTIARVASATWTEKKESATMDFRAALKEAEKLRKSGLYIDAVDALLSNVQHSEVMQELQPDLERCIGELNYEDWRSAGFRSLAEHQCRLGLFEESLRSVKKIPINESRAMAYASLAMACYCTNDTEQAASLFVASFESVDLCKEDQAKSESLRFVGDCLAQVGSFQGKPALLRRAVEASLCLEDPREAGMALRSIASALSSSDLNGLKAQLKDAGSFWRHFHMHLALTPALMKAGKSVEVLETVETACRSLPRINFAMSPRDAAEAFDFIVDTCCEMDCGIRVIGGTGIDIVNCAIPGHDSNYLGLVKLMLKQNLYQDATEIVANIGSNENRVKALTQVFSAAKRIAKPRHYIDALQTAVHCQEDWNFLLNITWADMPAESSIEWIRCFAEMCPENTRISLKLATDLVANNIRAGNIPAARQICNLCPKLELKGLLF